MLDTQMLSWGGSLDGSIPEEGGFFPSRRHDGHRPGMVDPQDLDQLTKNDHACRALWSSVIIQAIKDLFCIGSTYAPSGEVDRQIRDMNMKDA